MTREVMMARCEYFPCCGHELGDCNGQLYGSDEAIKARVEEDWRNGHGDCDHEVGIYNCWPDEDDEDGVESGSSEGFTGSPIHWADLARLLRTPGD